MWKSIVFAAAVAGCILVITATTHATDAFWSSGTGNWSTQNVGSGGTLGWIGPLPDAIADTGTYDTTGKSSVTTTQDLTGNRTVGKLEITGSANASWQITLASGKNLIMNHDGTGPGTAILSNTQTNSGGNPGLLINNSGGSAELILNDDLLVTNTGASNRSSGSIAIDARITGAGNITFYSVSNTIGAGHIALFRTGAGSSAFSGNSTIAKGALTFNRGDRFTPSPGNTVTIGSVGNGDATLAYAGGNLNNMENNIVAAAGTGGTNVLGATTAVPALFQVKSSSPTSTITLNGDLSFRPDGAALIQIGNPIIGAGKVTKIGPGPMRVTNTNTYAGGTVVSAGSLAVGHAPENNNGFGFYPATNGTLGSGNVTVESTATKLLIETELALIDVISNSKTLSLAGGGTADFADLGYLELGADINEIVGGLILGGVTQTTAGTYGSLSSTATFKSDEFFAGTGMITFTPATLAGDYNADGKVDAADYVLWRKSPGTFGGDPGGYTTWRANFGAGSPGAGSGLGNQAVPEPSTLLLVLVGILVTRSSRRR